MHSRSTARPDAVCHDAVINELQYTPATAAVGESGLFVSSGALIILRKGDWGKYELNDITL